MATVNKNVYQPQIDHLLLANSDLRARCNALLAATLKGEEHAATVACYIADVVEQRDALRVALELICRPDGEDRYDCDTLRQARAALDQVSA